VFGVSSAECLYYAVQNRQEWEKKGEEIVCKLKLLIYTLEKMDEESEASSD
jgi:hypothetical protein